MVLRRIFSTRAGLWAAVSRCCIPKFVFKLLKAAHMTARCEVSTWHCIKRAFPIFYM
ncbi:hypothetical protein HMPREF9554_02471 [Treponema phagedenis F0421]|nr:hypothetical protein HMPREF9554_02471 [Treponema phagedenis F0421]